MRYLTVAEIAEKWGISPRRVQVLCRSGRIPTALKIGHAWIIPDNVSKPLDARFKNPIEKNDKILKNIENFLCRNSIKMKFYREYKKLQKVCLKKLICLLTNCLQ